jgi:hypothetical protein
LAADRLVKVIEVAPSSNPIMWPNGRAFVVETFPTNRSKIRRIADLVSDDDGAIGLIQFVARRLRSRSIPSAEAWTVTIRDLDGATSAAPIFHRTVPDRQAAEIDAFKLVAVLRRGELPAAT